MEEGDEVKAAIQAAAEHEDCWHGTGMMLTSDPPLSVEVCCWCGSMRYLRVVDAVYERGEHGPHKP